MDIYFFILSLVLVKRSVPNFLHSMLYLNIVPKVYVLVVRTDMPYDNYLIFLESRCVFFSSFFSHCVSYRFILCFVSL